MSYKVVGLKEIKNCGISNGMRHLAIDWRYSNPLYDVNEAYPGVSVRRAPCTDPETNFLYVFKAIIA